MNVSSFILNELVVNMLNNENIKLEERRTGNETIEILYYTTTLIVRSLIICLKT